VRALAVLSGPLVALSLATPAAAEQIFPGLIQTTYGGTCAPQCTLCHTRPEGGPGFYRPSALDPGWVTKDLGNNRGEGTFFANLIDVNKGLPTGENAMKRALNLLATQNCTSTSNGPCDSDGDKIPDMQEFAKDGDPDVANGDLCVGPKYGCGATISPLPRESRARSRGVAVLALLGLGVVFGRRLTKLKRR
jgi:hypothetical protein